jgi:hypothetical protein
MYIWGNQIPNSCEDGVLDAVSRRNDGVAIQVAQTEPVPPSFLSCVQLAQYAGILVACLSHQSTELDRTSIAVQADMMIAEFSECLATALRNIRIENPYADDVGNGAYVPACS